MFPVVPCLLAFFAPLQAASAAPLAPPPAAVQQAASYAQQFRLQTPAVLFGPTAVTVGEAHGFPNALAPQIVVPDESRTRLSPIFGEWRLGDETPALPEAVARTAMPPDENLFARVRIQVRNPNLSPSAAASFLLTSAVENERVGHHNLAREDLDLALQRDPTHAEALRMRTGHRYDAKDYRGALRDAEAHLAARPASRSARYERANLLVWCDRPAEAHRELTALIRENPGEAKYYVTRAAAAFQLGRHWDGDLDSEIAVELAPADPACRLLRMKTCLANSRYAEAYAVCLAGDRVGDDAPAGSARLRDQVELLSLGFQHFGAPADRAGEFMTGLDWMVKTCPEYNPPRLMLAGEYLRAGRPDLAEQVATEALDRDPTDARAFHLRGKARAALSHPGAQLDFATALGLDDTAETRAELVRLHRAAGRRAEAHDLAEVGVELHPECGACRQFLADDDLRRGDFAAAERHATCALWLAHDRADTTAARLTRLLARLAQGDTNGAADDYAKLPVNEDVTVPLVTLELD